MINNLAMGLPTTGPTVEFYQQWSQYLSPMPHIFLTLIMLFMYSVALIFYYLASGVLDAYTNSFKLLDFLNIFFSPTSQTYQNWHLGLIIRNFMYLGIVAFGLMMLVQWIVFIATEAKKGREWPKGISITMGVIMALPFMVGILISIGTSMSQETIGSPNTNVITQLWQGNSTDLKKLASYDFDKSKYDKGEQYLVDDKKITGSDFHSVMSDPGYTDGLTDQQKKVFTQKVGGNNKLVDTTGGTLLLGKTFADEYPVMKTNWLGIIAGEIVFIFVVIAAIVRLFTAVYKMAFMTGSIVYFGLRDGTKGKRVQEIMSMIEGQITGIVIMPVSLIFFFAWVEFAFGVINGANLGMWPFTILSIAALVAGAKGLFTGFEMIEQWTGVRSGHNPVASMMMASQASRMAGGVAKSAQKNIGKGLKAISPSEQKKTREIGQKLADRHPLDMSNANTKDHTLTSDGENTGKLAGLATGAGRMAGAVKSPGQLLKSSGRAALDSAKSGVKGAVDNVKDYAGGIKDGYSGGKQAVDAFNKRHTPVEANLGSASGETPQNAHEALGGARSGIGRSADSELSVPSSSSSIGASSLGSSSSLKTVPGKPYIDGGYISRKPSSPSQPVGRPSSKPQIPVSAMTPEQRAAHDREVGLRAIEKQMAKGRKDKDSQSNNQK